MPANIAPFRLPLDRQQFENGLQKGLGRALMHVHQFGAAGMEDLILDACLHDKRYYPIRTGERAKWMIEVIDAGKLDSHVLQPATDRTKPWQEEVGLSPFFATRIPCPTNLRDGTRKEGKGGFVRNGG